MLIGALFVLLAQNREEVWIGTVYPETHPPIVRDRVEFTKKFDRIAEGMAMAQVRSILGPPDDVLERDETNAMSINRVIWKYGSIGKLSFAAYDEVVFEDEAAVHRYPSFWKVQEWHDEAELMEALHAIWDFAHYYLEELWFNPRKAVRAANRLIELGPEGASVALSEYSRLDAGADLGQVSILVHLLYIADEGQSQQGWTVVGGVPFETSFHRYGGKAYNPIREMAWLAETNEFRAEPFKPNDDLTPILDYVRDNMNRDVGLQLFSLLETVLSLPIRVDNNIPISKVEKALPSYLIDARILNVHWSDRQGQYLPVKGDALVIRQHLYKSFVWSSPLLDRYKVAILITRKSRRQVVARVIRIMSDLEESTPLPPIGFYIYEADGSRRLLAYATSSGNSRLPDAKKAGGRKFKAYAEKGGRELAGGMLNIPAWSFLEELQLGYGFGRSGPMFHSDMTLDIYDQPIQIIVEDGEGTYKSPLLRP